MAHSPEIAFEIIEGRPMPSFLFDDGLRYDLAATVFNTGSGQIEVFLHDVVDFSLSEKRKIAFIYEDKNTPELITTIDEGKTDFFKVPFTGLLEIWVETKTTNPVKKRATAKVVTDFEANQRKRAGGVTPDEEEDDEDDGKKPFSFTDILLYGGAGLMAIGILSAGVVFVSRLKRA